MGIRRRVDRNDAIDPKTRREAIAAATKRSRQILERSSGFQALGEERQEALCENIQRLIRAVSGPADLRAPELEELDLPEFVAGLIEGVFQVIVDTSIQQMEAYADLVAELTKSVEEFSEDAERQQLLATMVVMGINRIVVTDGQIRTRLPC